MLKNPSSQSRVAPGGRADGRIYGHAERERGITKFIVAFHKIVTSICIRIQIKCKHFTVCASRERF